MFDALRRMIKPIIFIVIVFFLGLIVVEWGLDFSGRAGGADGELYAGEINGEKISWDVYQRVYNQVYQNQTQNSEVEPTPGQIKQMEQAAWNQIVQEKLLMQEADKHNIVVTEKDVYNYIKFSPPQYLQQAEYFQTEGKFDYQKYINTLADPQAASLWAQIEPAVRGEVRMMKVQQIIIDAAMVTEPEIKQAFLDSTETATINLAYVPYSRFAGKTPAVGEDEMAAYYEKHKQKYHLPERAVVNIVLVDNNPTEYDIEIARDRAQRLYDSIKAGASFEELAQTFSEDVASARSGGDLGWINAGEMVRAFDSTSFALAADSLSVPFQTEFGWHIIKHKGYRDVPIPDSPGKHNKQANISHILIKANLSKEGRDRKTQGLENLTETAKEKGFEQAAKDAGLTIQKSPAFYRDASVGIVGMHAEANRFAFTEPVGTVSHLMDSDVGMFVMEIAERKPEGIAEYEEVKGRISQDIIRDKLAELARDSTNAIQAELSKGLSLEQAAKKYNATYVTAGPFTRTSYVEGIGRDGKAVGAAFGLTETGQRTGVIDYAAGSCIIELVSRSTPDLTAYNEQREEYRRALLQSKQQDLYSRWFQAAMKTSDIINNTQNREA